MTPLITILEPSTGNTSAEVVVQYEQGDAKVPLAIELKVKGREISLDGSKVNYLEDKSVDNFVVYPSQIVLMPGEAQRVQVKWVGETLPNKEITYGLIADQAPVKLGDEDKPRTKAEGRVNILTRYEGIIVVRPAGVRPNTIVDSAGLKKDSAGVAHLVLLLKNTGTGMQKLSGMKVRVTPLDSHGKIIPEKSTTFAPKLRSEQSQHSIFAGFTRKLDVPWPAGIPVGPVRAAVEFAKEK
ncbi:MAG: hypothetical protein PHC61_14040, partial [Chitinivibrionales bacterium]|nr:hypothetical protein [Chitinivibrionales bacterium]